MDRKIHKFFNDEAIAKIKDAVKAAEQGSTGEIVPCVVLQSSHYEEASIKAFFIALTLTALTLVAYEWKHDIWFSNYPVGAPVATTMILLFAGMTGYLLVHLFPGLRRKLLGKDRMTHATLRHAKVQFLENEVFRTKNRTGILIFVSLFERQVHVVPDKGLSNVDTKLWESVVGLIINGIRNGDPAQGMIDGIQKCGVILQAHPTESSSTKDELPNDLNIGRSDQ